MTSKEFFEKYGMTVRAAQIARKEAKEPIYNYHTKMEQDYICVGHGAYEPRPGMREVTVREYVGMKDENAFDYYNEILKPVEEANRLKTQRKHYTKELKELKERIAYLEKWLNEN